MAEIHAVVIVKAKAGSQEVLRSALERIVAQSQGDQGCLEYATYASATVPGAFVTIEKWASQADMEAHIATPHVQQSLVELDGHLDGDPVIHILGPLSA